MPLRAILTYDKPLVRQAVLCFWWRSVGWRFVAALAASTTGLATLLLRGDTSWLVGVLATIVAIGFLFPTALYIVHYRNSMSKLAAMGSPSAILLAEQDSVALQSDAGEVRLPWSSVSELWQFDDLWLLLFSRAQFVTLPLASLAPDLRTFIVERVRAAGGAIR